MKEYGTLSYLHYALQHSGIFEQCVDVIYEQSRMTLVLVVVKYRFFAEMITITRTSRKVFRVEHAGIMESFRSYKEAAVHVADLVAEILAQEERRQNYGTIFMQQLRAEAAKKQ